MLVDGADSVVTRWTGRGTHTGDLHGGISATGKKAVVQGIWINRLSNGKIVESWNAWDALGMLQQLGIVPTMG
jgi:predicted ester cyclase